MKWIKVGTGIGPEADVVLVLREDKSYDLSFKLPDATSTYKHPSGLNYFDSKGVRTVGGSPIYAFIEIPPFVDYELNRIID